MIEIAQALSLIEQKARPKPPVRVPLAEALGMTLAEDVTSDIDSPPHDKAMMDGYAVRSSDVASGRTDLQVLEEVTAGSVPSKTVTAGTATRIMTGAPIPPGADAVVMLEQAELMERDDRAPIVRIRQSEVCPGQNVMPRASSLARGEVVLKSGCQLRPIEVGLLAEVGRPDVAAVARPTAAVLATGDELVRASQRPAAGQIRNSNGPMLCALVGQAGAAAVDLGIARDERADLEERMRRGLEQDVLLLSGGVSAGALDLVPGVLSALGVPQVFHKVRLKPGKPLWFGVLATDEQCKLVFGLPGNPVSSLVCFQLFVRPALRRLAGKPTGRLPPRPARLAHPHAHRGDRPTYWPSRVREEGDRAVVEPLDWLGSADLRTLAHANCLIAFPAGDRSYGAGEQVEVHCF